MRLLKIVAITYKEYKKQHPLTRKSPDDPLFSHPEEKQKEDAPTPSESPSKFPDSKLLEQAKFTYDDAVADVKAKEEELFGGTPSVDQLQELKESQPDVFKEFNKVKRGVTKHFNGLRTSIIKDLGDPADVTEINAKFGEFGVQSKIDADFKGKMNSLGHYLTDSGEILTGLVGKDVQMNNQYDIKSDNTFYAKSTNPVGNEPHHYTESYMKEKRKEKFSNNVQMGQAIDQIRLQVDEDLNSPDFEKRTKALMVKLIDKAQFRIGNAESGKQNIRGLSNLLTRNVNIEGNTLTFKYTGKDKVKQKKIVVDEKMARMMEDLVKGKREQDNIFSPSNKPKSYIRADKVNSYLKDDLKSPVTIHKFRTFHATRMAKEELEKAVFEIPPKATPKRAFAAFQKAINKASKALGHDNSNTTIKHYIDSTILLEFFNRYNVEPPKVIKGLIGSSRTAFEAEDDIEVTHNIPEISDITDAETDFVNWMTSLPKEIMESEGIDFQGSGSFDGE